MGGGQRRRKNNRKAKESSQLPTATEQRPRGSSTKKSKCKRNKKTDLLAAITPKCLTGNQDENLTFSSSKSSYWNNEDDAPHPMAISPIPVPIDDHDTAFVFPRNDVYDLVSQKTTFEYSTTSNNHYTPLLYPPESAVNNANVWSSQYQSMRYDYNAPSYTTDSQYTRYNHGQCGLHNLGNTCFMNSILQCLNNVPPLVEHYLDPHHRARLSGNKHRVSTAFANLTESMRKHDTVRPTALKAALSKYAPLFRGYSQQDSHEYLTLLLDALHQESSTEGKDGEERSIVTDIFQGQMEYTIKCSEASRCKNITVTIDPFLDIPVFIEDAVTSSSPVFKVRLYTMDGHQKITDLPYSPADTIQSVIDHLQKKSSHSYRKSIIAMKVSPDNKFFDRYPLSATLSEIDDQLSIFYETHDSSIYSVTICMVYGRNWNATTEITYHPPLLLKLPQLNYENELHTCLSNHYHSSQLRYELLDNWQCHVDAAATFSLSPRSRIIVVDIDEETVQQCRSKCRIPSKTTIRQVLRNSSITLEQCLQNNISVIEHLSSNCTWFCSHCQQDRQLTKENHILTLPQVLIIHLKRFDMESPPPRTKIETFVKYPLELNMATFLSSATSSEEHMYDLIGVSLHSGSFEGGHYTANAKTASGWFSFNDSFVSPICDTEIVKQNAYVLFYLKRA